MADLITQLSFIVPALSFGFILILTSVQLYFKIRRQFPARVNCWFCNQDTKVPYERQNSWLCSNCEQYNGFKEDGDYNCDIPAQRNSRLNAVTRIHCKSGEINNSSNGFCLICNRNQELKIQQLASFVPEDENNYDYEVEVYRQKLENIYMLCSQCNRVLKKTLNDVKKRNILGTKLKEVGFKTVKALHLNRSNVNNVDKVQKRVTTICAIFIAILAILHFCEMHKDLEITKADLDDNLNPYVMKMGIVIYTYGIAIKHTILQYLSLLKPKQNVIMDQMHSTFNEYTAKIELPEKLNQFDLKSNGLLIINIAGVMLALISLIVNSITSKRRIGLLFFWSLALGLPAIELYSSISNVYHVLLKLAVASFIMTSSVLNLFDKGYYEQNLNNSFHRIENEDVSDSEYSDNEISQNTSPSNVKTSSTFVRPNDRFFNRYDVSNLRNQSFSEYGEEACLNCSLGSSQFGGSRANPSNMKTSSTFVRPFYRLPDRRRVSKLHNQSFGDYKEEACLNCSLGSSQFGGSRASLFEATTTPSIASFPKVNLNASFQDATSVFGSTASLSKSVNNLSKSHQSVNQIDSNRPQMNSTFLVPDPLHVGLGSLRISDVLQAKLNFTKPQSYLNRRRNIVSPSRFESQRPVIANQMSFIAGGYWNDLKQPISKPFYSQPESPKLLLPSAYASTNDDDRRAMSRTSSHSSGFDSRPGSAFNHGSASQEGSVCGDNVEIASVMTPFTSDREPLVQSNKLEFDFCNVNLTGDSVQNRNANGFDKTKLIEWF